MKKRIDPETKKEFKDLTENQQAIINTAVEHPDWSYSDISDSVGLSDSYVGEVHREYIDIEETTTPEDAESDDDDRLRPQAEELRPGMTAIGDAVGTSTEYGILAGIMGVHALISFSTIIPAVPIQRLFSVLGISSTVFFILCSALITIICIIFVWIRLRIYDPAVISIIRILKLSLSLPTVYVVSFIGVAIGSGIILLIPWGILASLIIGGTAAGESFPILILFVSGTSGSILSFIVAFIAESDLEKDMSEHYKNINIFEDHIENAEEGIVSQDIQNAAEQLNSAHNSLEKAKPQRSYPATKQQINKSEERLEAVTEKFLTKALRITDQAISDDDFKTAHTTFDAIDVIKDLSEPSGEVKKRIESLRGRVQTGREKLVTEKMDKMNSHIERANSAADERDVEQAYQHIESSNKVVDEFEDMGLEGNIDDVKTRLSELEEEVSDIESEQEISKIQDSISKSHGIEKSKLKTEQGTLESYKRLETLLDRIDDTKRNIPASIPFGKMRSNVIADLPEISQSQIDICIDIISDVEMIIEFMQDTGKSHPSVHAEEWHTAMETAVVHQNQDILNPVTSQVDRLEGDSLYVKEDLHKVGWEEFENLIGLLYEDLGYDATVTQGTSDMGVDVWAENGDGRVAVQVKQYTDGNTVGRETLQKVTSTIAKDDAEKAVVVTSSDFARTAEQYATDFGAKLEIINGDELVEMLSESDVRPPA